MKLGDVFRYRENLYVYLVQKDDITFVAKILSREDTSQLVKLREVQELKPNKKVHERPMFCFVVLSTDAFKDQGAHYGSPQMDTDVTEKAQFISNLNDQDIESLKLEIRDDIATFKDLRETFSKLFSIPK